MGAEAAAKDIRFAQFEHRRDTRSAWWQRQLDLASKWLIGYGLFPFRLLWWFGGLVALGWAVAFAAPALRDYSFFKRFWYSLENALPLVSLSKEMENVSHQGLVMHFFHAQKVLGFISARSLSVPYRSSETSPVSPPERSAIRTPLPTISAMPRIACQLTHWP